MRHYFKKFTLSLFLVPVLLFSENTPPAEPTSPVPEIHQIEESAQKLIPDSYSPSAIKVGLSLLGLVVFLLLAAYSLKKLTGMRGGVFGSQKGLKILERKPLSPKTVLYVVEFENKKVLIAESQLEVKALSSIENADLID